MTELTSTDISNGLSELKLNNIKHITIISRWGRTNARNASRKPRVKARTPEDGPIHIHPSSVMAPKYYNVGPSGYPGEPARVTPGANWLVYWRKQRSSDLFLIDVTLVYTLPFLFFGEFVVSEGKNIFFN